MGFLGRGIFDVEMGRFDAAMALEPRGEAALEHSADDQRAFGRIGRDASLDHLLDLRHQASRISHVRHRGQQELGGDGRLLALNTGGKAIVPDRAIQREQRGPQPIVVLDEVGGGGFGQSMELS